MGGLHISWNTKNSDGVGACVSAVGFPAGKLVWRVSGGLGEGHLMLFWLFPDSVTAG